MSSPVTPYFSPLPELHGISLNTTQDEILTGLPIHKAFLWNNQTLLLYSNTGQFVLYNLSTESVSEHHQIAGFGAHEDQDIALVSRRYLFAVGGGSGSGQEPRKTCVYDVFEHEPVESSSSSSSSLPPSSVSQRQSSTVLVTPAGGLYLVGGKDTEDRSILRTVQYTQMRRLNGGWKDLPSLHYPRRYAGGCVVADNRLVVVGGEYHDRSGEYLDYNLVEFFDGFQWTLGPTLKTARRHPLVVTLNGTTVVVLGGKNEGRMVNTVEVWDTTAESSEFLEIGTFPASSNDVAALAVGNEVYVVRNSSSKRSDRRVAIEKIMLDPNSWTRRPGVAVEQGIPPSTPSVPITIEGDMQQQKPASMVLQPNKRSLEIAVVAPRLPPEPPTRPNLPISETLQSRTRALKSYVHKLDELKEDFKQTVHQAMEGRLQAYNMDIERIQSFSNSWFVETTRLQQDALLEVQEHKAVLQQQQQQKQEHGASSAATAEQNGNPSDDIPTHLRCPITLMLMTDPVIAADGNIYERLALEEWFARQQTGRTRSLTSPLTGAKLESRRYYPVHALKTLCREFASKQE